MKLLNHKKTKPFFKKDFFFIRNSVEHALSLPEILGNILRKLKNKDLYAPLLVSKYWNQVAEEAWDCDISPVVGPEDVKWFTLNRWKRTKSVMLKYGAKWTDDDLRQFMKLPNLTSIEIPIGFDLSLDFSYSSFQLILPRLEALRIDVGGSLSIHQIFSILQTGSKMKKMDLEEVWLIQIPSETFSDVINSLKCIILTRCIMTKNQWALLFELAHQSTNLESLSIMEADLQAIDLMTFATALNRLKSLSLALHHDNFHWSQIEMFFKVMCQKGTNLNSLKLEHFDFREREEFDFAKALIKITDLKLRFCILTELQWKELFVLMCSDASKIKKLDIRDSNGFTKMDHKLFGRVIGNLDSALFFSTDMVEDDERLLN